MMISGMHPESLRGTSFFICNDDRTELCARIMKEDDGLEKSELARKDFIIGCEKDDVDDIMACNDTMNFTHMDRIEDEEHIWKFKTVLGHQGPLTPRHKHWKDSEHNV